MKKILLLGLVFLVTCFVGSLNAFAEGNELESGLAPGEVVVDTFTETFYGIPTEPIVTSGPLIPTDNTNPITTDTRVLSWYPVTKTYIGEVGSSWYYAGASTASGGVLHASHTTGVANTYSGQLETPLNRLTGYIGFETTKSYTVTVGYSTNSLPYGKYRLEYQHRYKKYQVKQERKYDSRASVVYGTAYVYPQQWVERRYRVVKLP